MRVLQFMRWVAITVWSAVLVLAGADFVFRAQLGLHWTDSLMLGVAGLAAYELRDWLR